MAHNVLEIINKIPEKPGCYLWKDQYGTVLYIGKAKNLKKRTLQYFNKSQNERITKLVSLIDNVDYIVVDNENESLILENNLIKEYQPRFNVLLKDGSNSYPYIVITNEQHPRIIYTRYYKKFKGQHYGPFANFEHGSAYEIYLLLNKLFKFRKCNKLPGRECMFYHLGQCLGPCINTVNQDNYEDYRKEIANIFNNKTSHIINELKVKEQIAAKDLNFEQAKIYFDNIQQLSNISQNQIAQLKQQLTADIIGFYADQVKVCINIFNYVNGKLLIKHAFVSDYFNDLHEVITSYLNQYYSENFIPKYIYVDLDSLNLDLLTQTLQANIIKPRRGAFLTLLSNAIENAKQYLAKNQLESRIQFERTFGAQDHLAALLKLPNLNHIEVIDNSNLFLENCVSAVVVFKNAHACKQLYRKYIIKDDGQKSDVHFMREVILRRYAKVSDYPDLLIVDGGKPQVSAALAALSELELDNIINVIGLVKNDKHQTDAIITSQMEVIPLDQHSYVYQFLANIQNEVHRFVITFFRQKNIKSKLTNFLDDVEGLGDKSKQKLLNLYPNLYDLKNLDISTIAQIIPKKAATNLKLKIDKELKDDKNSGR